MDGYKDDLMKSLTRTLLMERGLIRVVIKVRFNGVKRNIRELYLILEMSRIIVRSE